ncbi:MAG: hypothetical protein SPH34_01515 [Lachnospiraceae bacterium]|uniref:hypothetical protein n=1 Tax=Galactobacillus timonensis TaxID=2041840 RepID=UPI0023F199EC|nr:hypothetical protein [Galactobacillus timonensis]MDD7086650.1 hypothetical protein [Galactobacillus timonensis]MDY5221983.1 hypothetical protein [Lachnospiraceae bacterium]
MKSVQVYIRDTDEVLASFEEQDDGQIIGIMRDDVAVAVDGEILNIANEKD